MLFKIVIDKQEGVCIKKPFYLPSMWDATLASLSKSVLLSAADLDLVFLVATSLIVAFSSLEPFRIFLLFEVWIVALKGFFFFYLSS